MGMCFSPLAHPISFTVPDRLTDIDSWHQHIPFAMALVAVLRPRVLVELGTHRGDSYSAMCQAVDALGLSTRCFAVDTWKGDEHSGTYGEEVYAELRGHHDPRYARFSTLLRSTFDDAAERFAHGEIDLLHIDGLHTAEAVRHDFETWRPKLSDRAVVLFHDTSVRDRGFGVWRFWEEESRRHPSFAFTHGYGLGLLAVGRDLPEEIRGLCALGPEETLAVAQLYQALGERVEQTGKARRMGETIASLRAAVEALEEQGRGLADRLAAAEAEARRLREELETSWGDLDAALERARPRGLAGVWDSIRRRVVVRRIRRTGLFDPEHYRGTNDVPSDVDAIRHYVKHGAAHGLNPHAMFDTRYYVRENPDVLRSGMNPLLHFALVGAAAGRRPHPRYTASEYLTAARRGAAP